MFGLGLVELVVILLVFIAGFVIYARRGTNRFHLGHATLECPNCRQETPVTTGKCKHCGKEFL